VNPQPGSDGDDPRPRGGLARYAAAWLVAGALAASLLVVLLGREDTVELPPVRQIDLVEAARAARCQLASSGSRPLNPPVDGPAGEPAAPGVYDVAPDVRMLIGALRRGRVVIHYRPGLADRRVRELERLQEAVPEGTLVVPNATRMPYEVAITAWRRLLGCQRFTDEVTDALRLFRGRFLGSGPDGPAG
jgi:hypothetical protein